MQQTLAAEGGASRRESMENEFFVVDAGMDANVSSAAQVLPLPTNAPLPIAPPQPPSSGPPKEVLPAVAQPLPKGGHPRGRRPARQDSPVDVHTENAGSVANRAMKLRIGADHYACIFDSICSCSLVLQQTALKVLINKELHDHVTQTKAHWRELSLKFFNDLPQEQCNEFQGAANEFMELVLLQ